MQKLSRAFYARDTITVAKELLGKYLVHITDNIERIGKIIEVEAYLGPHDLAAHSSKGLTKRTQVMFGPPRYAYVYLIYGLKIISLFLSIECSPRSYDRGSEVRHNFQVCQKKHPGSSEPRSQDRGLQLKL
jgi:DNA-3-methyladenine glycosylase